MKSAVAGEDDFAAVMINPDLEAKKLWQRYKAKNYDSLLKHILKDLNAVIEEYTFLDEINAVCFKLNGIFVIGINKNRTQGDKNFFVAHELGHHILSHSKTISINLKSDHCLSLKRISAMDIQANLFAAELLMPEDLLRESIAIDMDISRLAHNFSVSKEAEVSRGHARFYFRVTYLGTKPDAPPSSS